MLRDEGDHRPDRGDDRQHDAAGHDRADERGICQPDRAVPGEEADETLVVPRDPVDAKHHVRDDETRHDRQCRERDERDEDAEHIGPDRMALAGQRREAAPERARLLVEYRKVERRPGPVGMHGDSRPRE
jgi:hypothetical protein